MVQLIHTDELSSSPKVGISACLLGEPVRYDGGHRLDLFITRTWGRYVRFIPVCPEVEAGLGVPREPIRIIGDPSNPRLITERSRTDLTEKLLLWAGDRVSELAGLGLWGFIFKSGSPSCGMRGVKVHKGRGRVSSSGVGIFARAFIDSMPLVPVTDELRFHDPDLREDFVEALFVMERWRRLRGTGAGPQQLAEFHRRHELFFLSRSPKQKRKMEALLAGASRSSTGGLYAAYESLLLETLRYRGTQRKRLRCLHRVLGRLRGVLTKEEREEIVDAVGHYGLGRLPLVVPLALLGRCIKRYGLSLLEGQYFINPHPVELLLRNHP